MLRFDQPSTIASSPSNVFNHPHHLFNLINRILRHKPQADPPCVPYIGVYLKDLTFIDDGNEDYLHNLINYGKRKMAQDQIAKIQLYQSTRFVVVVFVVVIWRCLLACLIFA